MASAVALVRRTGRSRTGALTVRTRGPDGTSGTVRPAAASALRAACSAAMRSTCGIWAVRSASGDAPSAGLAASSSPSSGTVSFQVATPMAR